MRGRRANGSRRIRRGSVRRLGDYETMRSGQLKSAVSHESQSPKRELPEDEKPHLLRFGLFDLNIQTRELRKAGLRVSLSKGHTAQVQRLFPRCSGRGWEIFPVSAHNRAALKL